jgi:hypothetical protein
MEVKDMGILVMHEAIEKWQEDNRVHPLTCGTCNHVNLKPCIEATGGHISLSSQAGSKIVLECPQCDYKQEYVPECVYRWYAAHYLSHLIPLGQVVEVEITEEMDVGASYRVNEFVYDDGTIVPKSKGVIGEKDIHLGTIGKLKGLVVGHTRDCDGEPLYVLSDIRVKFNDDRGLEETLSYKKWSSFFQTGFPESCLKVIEGEFVPLEYGSIFDYERSMFEELNKK